MPGGRERRGGSMRTLQDRTRIAQVTARLIADHGMTDWSAAKRKAARQLGLPDTFSLPSNEDVQQALTEHHALFADAEHEQSLQRQRTAALRWMRRLERWSPLLVGGVAAGWAGVHSDVRIELVADDPKSVEIVLASEGVHYAALSPRGDERGASSAAELLIHATDHDVRVSVLTPVQRRNRRRKDDEPRLDIAEVAALIRSG